MATSADKVKKINKDISRITNEIIDGIYKACEVYFLESTFALNGRGHTYIIAGSNYSKARNHYNNDSEEVDVVKWFDDFWLYMEITIQFDPPANRQAVKVKFPNVFLSLSIFHGNASDSIKNQLFRAEWDNYRNPNEEHPQPHWHVYPVQYDHLSFSDLLKTLKDDEDSFVELLNNTKSKFIDIKRIHFAMNGQWSSEGKHVHEINDKDTITNWLSGVLGCIKTQLKYVS